MAENEAFAATAGEWEARWEEATRYGLIHKREAERRGERIDRLRHAVADLRARLAEVEAERDEAEDKASTFLAGYLPAYARAEAAEARLAAVEALCDGVAGSYQTGLPSFAAKVRAAARGEAS